MLVRLVYISRASQEATRSDQVVQILETSRSNNSEAELSGLLAFDKYNFLQCLEGERDAVNALYNRLLHDDRHTDVVITQYQEIAKRDFGEWDMGFANNIDLGERDLYQMTGEETYAVLKKCAERNAVT